MPPPLAEDLVSGPAGEAMQMTWRLLGQEPVEVPGGRVRIVDSNNFHAASTIAAALVELDPGAMRNCTGTRPTTSGSTIFPGRGE